MKKRILAFVAFLAIMLALPAAVYAVEPAPPNATYGTMQVETLYPVGEEPNIPQTITRFGSLYHLVSQAPAVPADSLALERTYSYMISADGVTEEQIRAYNINPDDPLLQFRKGKIPLEKTVDKVETMPMATNDVDEIPPTWTYKVASYAQPDGNGGYSLVEMMVDFERTGVSFDEPTIDDDGLPSGYTANVIYRGIEVYLDDGYFIDETVRTTTTELTDMMVIIANYQTDTATIADIVEVIGVAGGGAAAGGAGGAAGDAGAGEAVTPPVDIPAEDVPADAGETATVDIADNQIPQGTAEETKTQNILLPVVIGIACILVALFILQGMRRHRKARGDRPD